MKRLMLVCWLALAGVAVAQDAPPAPAASTADLEAQVKTLKAQLAAVAQRLPQPTAADQTAKARAVYDRVFSDAKHEALAPCRAAGGTLTVTVDVAAQRVSVSCALK